jgi:hypothetical protein
MKGKGSMIPDGGNLYSLLMFPDGVGHDSRSWRPQGLLPHISSLGCDSSKTCAPSIRCMVPRRSSSVASIPKSFCLWSSRARCWPRSRWALLLLPSSSPSDPEGLVQGWWLGLRGRLAQIASLKNCASYEASQGLIGPDVSMINGNLVISRHCHQWSGW